MAGLVDHDGVRVCGAAPRRTRPPLLQTQGARLSQRQETQRRDVIDGGAPARRVDRQHRQHSGSRQRSVVRFEPIRAIGEVEEDCGRVAVPSATQPAPLRLIALTHSAYDILYVT